MNAGAPSPDPASPSPATSAAAREAAPPDRSVEGSRVALTLIAAYRATHYCVNGVSPPFLLRIDEPNADLASCHRASGVHSSAFLTAWNPGSRPTAEEENEAAQQRLKDLLNARGFALLGGLGVDPSGQWAGEESLLVLGIRRDTACDIGRSFLQHGIVWADRDAVPRLVMLE